MTWNVNPGRVAGCLYLLTGFSVVRPMYIGQRLISRDDPHATLQNIAAHEALFRFGILCDLIAGLGCLLTALALYWLLRGVSEKLGVLMVILGGLMPCVIDCLNALNNFPALFLARREAFLSNLDEPQRAALALLSLRLYDYGALINQIFAGLWLFPFGVLVWRSGFLPKILGPLMMIAGVGYLAISGTGLLAPQYVDRVSRFAMPFLLGEGGILLWLLVKGARPPGQGGEPKKVCPPPTAGRISA
jgi:hypothetical protein